jgi:hypothetical protein
MAADEWFIRVPSEGSENAESSYTQPDR